MVFDPNFVHVDPEHPEIEDDVQLPDEVVVCRFCGACDPVEDWRVHCENGRRCVRCDNIADVPTSEIEEAAAEAEDPEHPEAEDPEHPEIEDPEHLEIEDGHACRFCGARDPVEFVYCENGLRCTHCMTGLNIADVAWPVTPPTSHPNAELEVALDMLFGERTEEKDTEDKESDCRAS